MPNPANHAKSNLKQIHKTASGDQEHMHPTVLIAEDEPYIVQSLSFLLEKEGLNVDVAVDGRQTLDMLRNNPPDILLLDLMMEHLTGFEVLKILRSESQLKDIKVLVLSAKGQENDRRQVMELGADKFITKPYANNDVVVSVLELLDLKPE
jgi:DNA-binding response OmpR family regulator